MPLRQLKDALLRDHVALPIGDATVYSRDFDLGKGEKFELVELHVEIPPLALTALPNAKNLTVKVFHGDTENPTDELSTLGTITGATGTNPSAAVTYRYRYPPTVGRYLRVGIVGDDDVAASEVEAEVSLVF